LWFVSFVVIYRKFCERMVYGGMFFLGCNFMSSLLFTLKSKKKLKTFFLKNIAICSPGLFSSPVCGAFNFPRYKQSVDHRSVMRCCCVDHRAVLFVYYLSAGLQSRLFFGVFCTLWYFQKLYWNVGRLLCILSGFCDALMLVHCY